MKHKNAEDLNAAVENFIRVNKDAWEGVNAAEYMKEIRGNDEPENHMTTKITNKVRRVPYGFDHELTTQQRDACYRDWTEYRDLWGKDDLVPDINSWRAGFMCAWIAREELAAAQKLREEHHWCNGKCAQKCKEIPRNDSNQTNESFSGWDV